MKESLDAKLLHAEKTIELNEVKLTVPNTDNCTINDSATLNYYSYICHLIFLSVL